MYIVNLTAGVISVVKPVATRALLQSMGPEALDATIPPAVGARLKRRSRHGNLGPSSVRLPPAGILSLRPEYSAEAGEGPWWVVTLVSLFASISRTRA